MCETKRSTTARALRCAAYMTALLIAASASADLIESRAGVKIEGKIISRTADAIEMDVTAGGKAVRKKYPTKLIHAVTIGDQREVLNPKAGAPDAASTSPPGSATNTGKPAGGSASSRDIDQIIEQAGRTPPDWFTSTPLNYPDTLDLTWPQPPQGGWNNKKNIGQYIWDIINPNPGKWREGVVFMHHLLGQYKDNRELQQRTMEGIGRMYHHLLEDYARAAFWWRQAGVEKSPDQFPAGLVAHLAECYWKMGDERRAKTLLSKGRVSYPTIKLMADMGETDAALKMVEMMVRGGADADDAYLYAGDACRQAGQFRQALNYYQKVLDVPAADDKRVQRNHDRARSTMEAIKLFETLDLKRIADGAYQDSSLGYEGPITVEVSVAAGRIEAVKVVKHTEKQFYSAISDTTRKIVEKQSMKVDATSSATITSEAIINATAKALAGATPGK